MKPHTAALVAAFSLALPMNPLHAVELSGNTATFTDEEIAQCEDGGGCLFVSRAMLLKTIEEQSRKMAGSCGNRT